MTATLAVITTRPVGPGDDALLRELYVSTRRDELAAFGWPTHTIETFGMQQYEARHHHYSHTFPTADRRVIVVDGHDVGQVIIDRPDGHHTLVDISLFPAARGRGIGTTILRELIDAAERRSVPLDLSVLNTNPARQLYARLGFTIIGSDEIRTAMRRHPVQRAPIRKDIT